ncbi:IS1595 family transposase [Aliifodinibius halophilus]|uniref:IS1595 family transposase n=1 Tax=Fodinibius halophilus TaxID=1736908 RepID=A0A6M1SUS9_9BACT|nr:IS1595 family transposase [Fodinibius halophilus]NGP87698.1 IS1595 family transposase [Fodinibius halophilus]
MNNKYVNRGKISEYKFRELVRLFALDLTATQIAELSGLNRNTVNRYLKGIRQRLAAYCYKQAPFEVSYMEQIGEGCQNNFCLGICEENSNVYACIVEEKACMNPGIQKQHCLDVILNFSENKQVWLVDRRELQKVKPDKISCIDGFRGFLKSRLEKFKGIHQETYILHLKESEFRFNNPKEELYRMMLKIFRRDPLF